VDRWRMHRLGFVNFWLYDVEEFSLEDGHILLRGANGSGKSITTQSFIPFLLDGNKSPERLDPFGSRDRRMEFYLLGDGEHEESTGYLYIEFKKDGLEEYLAIGIGMRAQKGKGIDFWGFCLCDGRRIGPEGVLLYQTVGGQFIPLSKQKLKNLLNSTDNWTESQGAFKQLVNDRLFQFRDIRQYDQLIQLLVKVRAPKLSKESFRPTEVKNILKDSLQILTDEDLSAMVSTMERMDALEDTLRDHRAAMRDSITIRNEYNRYNQFILGLKGQAYLDAMSKTERLQDKQKDAQANLEAKRLELQEQMQHNEDANAKLEQAKVQRSALGGDDLAEKHGQLENEQGNRKQLEIQLSSTKMQLNKIQHSIEQKEVDLRVRTREREDTRASLHNIIHEFDKYNKILELGADHEHYYSHLKKECLTDDDLKRIQNALKYRKKQLTENLSCLHKVEQAQSVYDSACQALDQAASAATAAKREVHDAEQQEQEERDRLIEAIVLCQSINQELLFSQTGLLSLRQAVARYHSPADWSSVRQLVDDCYSQQHRLLTDERLKAEQTLQEIQKSADDIRRDLERIRRQPEPIPPRSGQIEATRTFLTMRGIPCAPFFETITFQPDLSQAEQDLLEAQLTDAGLLDALVISKEHKEQLIDLLSYYPDRFLIPGQPVKDPVTAIIPDESNPLSTIAAQCLQGISRSDLAAHTALLSDGSFRNGSIRGHSLAESPAGYVGATARRANRERQLRLLEEQLDEVERKRAVKQDEVDVLLHRLKILDEERSDMPSTIDLDQALGLLNQSREKLKNAEKEEAKQSDSEQLTKRQLTQLEQESRDLSRGLPYARTVEAYEEAYESANEYGDILSTLNNCWNKLQYSNQTVEDLTRTIDEQRDNADQMQKKQASEQRMLGISDAKIYQIQEFLDRPENQVRAQRLMELEREINNQDKISRDAGERCAALKADINYETQLAERYTDELRSSLFSEHDLENYFLEDLSLGFTMKRENLSLSHCARQSQSKIQAADRERTPEMVGESLRNNYQQHNNSLLKYMPKIETIFDPPSQTGILRQRLAITLQKDGKELSLYDFINELQRDIDLTEMVLEQKDRELFEDILTDTISHKLRARIEESQQWSRDMSALMKTLDTSMGLTFSLDWKAKKAVGAEELDTAQLVMLLNKDRALLTREDSQRVSTHFRSKVKAARLNAEMQDQAVNYADLIREVLDYRTWYEFQLYYQREGEVKRDLTDRIFNTFSGGEKAMAIYLPLFAAVSAQYQKGGSCSPMLLALDEAFAGVDDKNIGAMFDLVHSLKFDYILNSQALWGCYPCVKSLDIAEFHRPNNAQVVTIIRYRWNGKEKILLD
jgi:uncharacterized protein (TIGR02680 family)